MHFVCYVSTSVGGPPRLRTSRSHESLLSSQSIMQTLDLSAAAGPGGCGGVEIKPLHPSVLGREHCFQVYSLDRGLLLPPQSWQDFIEC